jgi:flavin reductase
MNLQHASEQSVAPSPHAGLSTAPDAVAAADFKLVMRQVVSSVAIITSRLRNVRNGLTATAVCSLSSDPPMMLACVNSFASAEKLIAESGVFAINFLTEEQHRIARLFSTSKLPADQRFAEGTWVHRATGAPILEDAVASLDCLVEERIVSGTHHIYLGRVLAVSSLDQHALLYRDGVFRKLAPVT